MKKIILSGFIALALLFTTTSCDNDDDNHETAITVSDLPQTATTFVTTYFPNANYRLIEKQDRPDADGSIYDVYLTNGFEIDFDIDGNWVDIDGNHQPVPVELVPEKIQAYVTANYGNQSVTAIDKEPTYIEVELTSTIELIFNLQGDFIRIDN